MYKRELKEIDTLEYIDIPKEAHNIWNSPDTTRIKNIPTSIFLKYNKLFNHPVNTSIIKLERYLLYHEFHTLNKRYVRVEFEFNEFYNKIIFFDLDEITTEIRKQKFKQILYA